MNGIMSGIVPRTNAYAGYYNQETRLPGGVPITSLEESYTPGGFELWDWAKPKAQVIETPGGKTFTVKGGKEIERFPPYFVKIPLPTTKKTEEPVVKNGKTLGDDTGLGTGTGAESDLETMKSYMKMFEGALGADADETRRQKYLELAKFGANLVAQPGGDLMEAVGKAAAPSIEGVSKIIGGERDVKRQARIAGLQAALKGIDPTSLEKTVRYLKKQGYSEAQAINMALSGTATKGKTKESRITSIADDILQSGGAKDQATAKKISQKIESSPLHFYEYSPLPENPIEGQYYYDKEGTVGQYQIKDGKSGLYEQD